MRTRTDFVSNSSSSSFIIQDTGFFAFFGITVSDIRDAVLDLCGGKEVQDKLLANEIKRCDEALAKDDVDEWSKKCFIERKADLEKNGLRRWVIYDMTDDEERKKCYEEWDSHFENWTAPSTGDVSRWQGFEDIVDCKLGSSLSFEDLNDFSIELKYYDHSQKKYVSLPTGSKAFCNLVREKLGIKSMKEVLHDKDTTLMVHFDDNEVYNVRGMQDYGKADHSKFMYDNDNVECNSSAWDSPMYSKDRFFEILIKYFIDKGKINLADKDFMDFWLVPEDHWWKKDQHYKDKKYFTKSEDTATWKEVVDDMLNDNSIMHEG